MKKRNFLLILMQLGMMLLFLGYYWYRKGAVTPGYLLYCIYLIPAVMSLCVAGAVARSEGVMWIVLYMVLAAVLPPLCYYCTYCISAPPESLAVLLPPGAAALVMAALGLCAGLFQRKLDREGRSDDPYGIKSKMK